MDLSKQISVSIVNDYYVKLEALDLMNSNFDFLDREIGLHNVK